MKKVEENVDLNLNNLSHLRLLNIKAVSRNVSFSTTRAVEAIIWQVYVVSWTERQPYWIPSVQGKEKRKQITVLIGNVYNRDFFFIIDFFFN